MPVLLLNAVPRTVNLNLTSSIIPIAEFSRASVGTYFDDDSVMQSAAIDIPRFPDGGLLYEPQRQNVHTRSWRISSWNNNAATSVTDNAVVSPDGTQNATEIIAGLYKGRFIYVNGLSTSTNYAISGYVKSSSGTGTIRVGTETAAGVGGTGTIDINAATGSYSKGSNVYDASTTLLPNGWVYFKYRIATGASQTGTAFVAYSLNSTLTYSIWGCQVEADYQASSLIHTDGSAVTRATDELSFKVPSGVTGLRYVFDDDSTQDVSVSSGSYTVPTNLNRSIIKRIVGI